VGWLWPFKNFNIFLHLDSPKEDFRSDVWQMFGEPFHFFFDLVSEFSDVTENQCRTRLWVFFKLLQNRNEKHCGLSHTGYGLAEDVSADDGLGDALLLHLRRMLKPTVHNSSVQLIFKQEIFEACSMNTGITTSDSIC
jgi:hypothetical protein